jgi:hypothetical protein
LVFPDVQITKKETRKVPNQTGTVKRRVSMEPNPRALTMERKEDLGEEGNKDIEWVVFYG